MPPAFRRLIPDRRRATSFLLALVIEGGLILVLLLWGLRVAIPAKPEKPPISFSMSPDNTDNTATHAQQQKAKAAAKSSSAAAAAPPPTPPIPPQPLPTPVPKNALPGVVPLSLADNDISKMKGTAPQKDEGDDAGDSKLAYGPGEGPGGMPLYRAEWYREPTNAELNGYVKTMPEGGGWALIACKTVANYHVENCQSLGESPPGSGLARDMRQAAWQFLVRPPRRGGKALVGAWVSIRIDFHVTTVRNRDDGEPRRARDGGVLPPEPKSRYAPEPDAPAAPATGGFTLPPDPKKKYGP